MADRQPKYSVGQVVRLNSGSPKMTIRKANTKRTITSNMKGVSDDFDGTYNCQWFDGNDYKDGDFSEESLILD